MYPDIDEHLPTFSEELAKALRDRGHPVLAGAREVVLGWVPAGVQPGPRRELGRRFHSTDVTGELLAECVRVWDGVIARGIRCTLGEGIDVMIEISYPFPMGPFLDLRTTVTTVEDGETVRTSWTFRMEREGDAWQVRALFFPCPRH